MRCANAVEPTSTSAQVSAPSILFVMAGQSVPPPAC
jgi:hypothetical protein